MVYDTEMIITLVFSSFRYASDENIPMCLFFFKRRSKMTNGGGPVIPTNVTHVYAITHMKS